ncbi:MAG: hypothetical protein ABIS29_18515 [Vicinamibacterales bacterium]
MLWWLTRRRQTPAGYQRSLLAYAAIFVLPTACLIVPAAMELLQRAGVGTSWVFLLTATLLGQLLPMFATHGFLAMYRPETWSRLVSLRKEAHLTCTSVQKIGFEEMVSPAGLSTEAV